jgi:release factor glutamine methyltransferase
VTSTTIKAFVAATANKLAAVSSTPKLDAELLLAHVLAKPRSYLIGYGDEQIQADVADQAECVIERRSRGEPIAYLLGYQEFYGRVFSVNPSALIPRPETELLVEEALAFLRAKDVSAKNVLDLGTGSGCIAVTLACEAAINNYTAVDKSIEALNLANTNAANHDVLGRISFVESDWFSNLDGQQFSLIVANPPYIAHGDSRCSIETSFEPQSALFAEDEGLADIRKIVSQLPTFLAPGGLFLCEFGDGQAGDVLLIAQSIVGQEFGDVSIKCDLAGIERLVKITRA